MRQDIRGRVACITGAGRGIGRAIAVGLAEEGCHVALLARREEEVAETARLCRERAVRALPLPTDVTDAEALAAAIERCVEELGGLNVLVNNAGIFDWASADEADPDVWDHLIDVNLKSAMHATRLALPHIKRGGPGAVVFIASMAGKAAFGMNAAYVASKHGMVGFAGSVFQDVRDHDIKVCAVCPGLVNAGAARRMDVPPGKFEEFIQPEDVAEAVRFVVTSPSTVCPTEILLNPQKTP